MDKKHLYHVFKSEILNLHSINDIAKLWNLHTGTINRWILKQEVPSNYFNHINKLLNHKYQADFNEQQYYKNMDQFFTPVKVAKQMIEKTVKFIKKHYDIDLKEYDLIEPSAGNGSFSNNFPKELFNQTYAFDIEPQIESIIKQDWLEYYPKNERNIVIGNPPFGLRGQLALQFINHAAKFCDFICFILPPLFNSNGKGSPMLRINKNFYLAAEFKVNDDKFHYPNNKIINVKSIFQIWTKLPSHSVKPIKPSQKISEWIKVYSLSNGSTPSSKRNVKMLDKCDYYLPSTTFSEVSLETCFSKLPHNRGYGIVILKEKQRIQKIIESVDWKSKSFKSTNFANNLRTQLIIDAVEERIKND
ncbi:hypothetical protein ACR82Z_01010 [Mycoplasma sp. 6243]|uniref:hypothetical protein n=1 Tax=Mycoplasma sp. 6243 TaxID=3440865 RepID=UPI003EB72642